MNERRNAGRAARRHNGWSQPGRLEVTRVPLLPVARFSLLIGASVVTALITGIVTLYALASGSGALGHFDTFVADTLGAKSFQVELAPLLVVTLIVGSVIVVIATLLGVLMAAAYNWFAWSFGGLQLVVASPSPVVSRAPARAPAVAPEPYVVTAMGS
jgi:hypothetical protein